jgi:hypothetical protein
MWADHQLELAEAQAGQDAIAAQEWEDPGNQMWQDSAQDWDYTSQGWPGSTGYN